jgi:two-component system sensor histidine kinase GlrK
MLWQANQTLENMAKTAATEPAYAVSVTRNVYQLERLALDIERITRQYQVLRSDDARTLAFNYFEQYEFQLDNLCEHFDDESACSNNREAIAVLKRNFLLDEQQLSQALSVLRNALSAVKKRRLNQLEARIAQQQTHIETIKRRQFWFTVVLIALSVGFAWYGSNKILSPVTKLNQLIRELSDKKHQLSPVSARGPAELIELQHKLHSLAFRLNQLESLRQAMLRHAAHELKTPLASIKEGCSLLSDSVLGELNEQQSEVVSLLNTSSVRLENLISQLLDYTTLLQQAKPSPQAIATHAFFDTFLNENQLALKQNNHTVSLNIALETLYADEVLLRRILDNLLSNAIAYSEPQSIITIHLYLDGVDQTIEVANNGEPIKPDISESLFKPFQRGTTQRLDRVASSGLGLSIVAECASLMSGSVGFVQCEKADVCVRVVIPLGEERV